MDKLTDLIRKYILDVAFLLLTAAGAVACWFYGLPTWLLVICVILFIIGLVSLLGDLGVFGRPDFD